MRPIRSLKAEESFRDGVSRPFLHLVDGGVSDNLGVRGIVESLIARGGIHESLRALGLEKTRRVAIVIVDAKTEEKASWQISARMAPSVCSRLPTRAYHGSTSSEIIFGRL